jgi:hypothetical protein
MPQIFTTPCVKTKPNAISEQIRLARQSRLKVQNALAQQIFSENSSLKLSPNTAVPISEILEGISQNISKMDQNLYTAKANMEEILRVNSNDNEFVSLD